MDASSCDAYLDLPCDAPSALPALPFSAPPLPLSEITEAALAPLSPVPLPHPQAPAPRPLKRVATWEDSYSPAVVAAATAKPGSLDAFAQLAALATESVSEHASEADSNSFSADASASAHYASASAVTASAPPAKRLRTNPAANPATNSSTTAAFATASDVATPAAPTAGRALTEEEKRADRRRRNREASSRSYYRRKQRTQGAAAALAAARVRADELHQRERALRKENAELRARVSWHVVPRLAAAALPFQLELQQ